MSKKYHKIDLPILDECLKDCYCYAPVDAPIAVKEMLLSVYSDKLDELILKEKPNHVDGEFLKKQLKRVVVNIKHAK